MKKLLTVFAALFLVIGWTSSIQAEEKSDQFIIINKTINKLAFYEKGELIKTFSVGTGREQTYTPEGVFTIVNKIKNRPYYTKNIPGGDPRNPLGDRWMGLNARGTYGTTYGIHGNSNESSIGKYVSAGCVRMHNQEVRWLFDQVKLHTPVIITRSKDSFDAIAIAHQFDVGAAGPIEKYQATLTLLEDVKLYSKPSLSQTTKYALSAQKVSAFEKAGNWYHIKTWFGDAWFKSDQLIKGEIEKVDLPLTLLENTALFQKPILNAKTPYALTPQKVVAFEKAGEWYHIKTWFGDAWLTSDQIIEGNIETVDLSLLLVENTTLYKKPNLKATTPYALSPQKVLAFEKAGDWYHIKTWFGDAWLKPEKVVAGEFEKVDSLLMINEGVVVRQLPLEDSKSLATLSTQTTIQAFEKWEDWYHIHGPNGDGWIKGSFATSPSIPIESPEKKGGD